MSLEGASLFYHRLVDGVLVHRRRHRELPCLQSLAASARRTGRTAAAHEPGLVARIRPGDHGLARRQPDAEGEVEPALVGLQHRVRPGGGQVTVRSRSAWSEARSAASPSNYGEPVGSQLSCTDAPALAMAASAVW